MRKESVMGHMAHRSRRDYLEGEGTRRGSRGLRERNGKANRNKAHRHICLKK